MRKEITGVYLNVVRVHWLSLGCDLDYDFAAHPGVAGTPPCCDLDSASLHQGRGLRPINMSKGKRVC
jgi:hypothetical protein